MKKLNTKGFSHIVLPMLAVLMIAAVGTYVLTASHADTPAPTTDPNWSKTQIASAAGITYKSPGAVGNAGTGSGSDFVKLTYQTALKPGQTSGSWGTLTGVNTFTQGTYIGSGRINRYQYGSSGPTVAGNALYQVNYYAATPAAPADSSIAIYCGDAGTGSDTGVPKSSGAVTLNPAVVTLSNTGPTDLFTNINGKFVSFQATQPCTDTSWTGPTTITSNIMANTAPSAVRIGTGQIAAAYLNKNSKVEAYLSGTKWTHVNTLVNKTGFTVTGSPALVSTSGNAVKLMVLAQSGTGPTVLLEADSPDITRYGLSTLSLAQTDLPATNQLIQPVRLGDGYIHLFVTDPAQGAIYQLKDALTK